MPSFHVGGMLGLLVSLYSGETTVIQPRFDAGGWLSLVATQRVNSAFLVPTMLARILDHPDLDTTDVSSLHAVAYGAAAAPVELVRRAMAQWPDVAFANVFGQTETLGAYTTLSAADHHDPARAGSVGRPLPGVEVRVVDPDTGGDLGADGVGELWVRSPQNLATGTDAEGWLHTGDLARQDADGYLFPIGRRSDGINRGGEKFTPNEVAEILRQHPAVGDVVVVGLPDPEMGERVGVAVVVAAGRDEPTLDELRQWCTRADGAVQASRGAGCRRRSAQQRAGQVAPGHGGRSHPTGEPGGPPMTLYLHECHHVIGQHEEEFEAAYRDPGGWMDRLGQDDEARLLWYANQVHGTGPAYRVITITAVHDGAAWERLSQRVRRGDLSDWTRSVDRLRRTVTAKVLTAVPWSPIGDLDLAAEPAEPADHEPTLFMEDTGWPHVPLDDYLDYWGDTYLPMLQSLPDRHAHAGDPDLLDPHARRRAATRGHPVAADPQPRRAAWPCSPPRSPPPTRPPAPTWPTPSPTATSGSHACCAPPPGRRDTEASISATEAASRASASAGGSGSPSSRCSRTSSRVAASMVPSSDVMRVTSDTASSSGAPGSQPGATVAPTAHSRTASATHASPERTAPCARSASGPSGSSAATRPKRSAARSTSSSRRAHTVAPGSAAPPPGLTVEVGGDVAPARLEGPAAAGVTSRHQSEGGRVAVQLGS